MRFARWGLLGILVAVGVVASARWTLQAQDRAGKARPKAEVGGVRGAAGSVSIQDALLRPLDLPFEQETSLEEVRQYLGRALGAQVVLDRAALDRLELKPDDTVQLDLKGVRLKVGLKLLLDQVGLSYRVLAEDNLLILTDPEGSDDPEQRALAELKSLHREMHDLQDAVDDLRGLVEEELGIEPERVRNQSTLVRLGRGKLPLGRSKAASPRLGPTSGVGG
jgi:hypothetical protein